MTGKGRGGYVIETVRKGEEEWKREKTLRDEGERCRLKM